MNKKRKSRFPFPNKGKQVSSYAKYSGLAFQMIIILLLGAWGGKKLDTYFENEFPAFTLALLLLGLIAVIYLTIRSVINK